MTENQSPSDSEIRWTIGILAALHPPLIYTFFCVGSPFWLLIGFAATIFCAVQSYFMLEKKHLRITLLVGPILMGLLVSFSSLLYEVFVIKNYNWSVIYALVYHSIAVCMYSAMITNFIITLFHPEDGAAVHPNLKASFIVVLITIILGISTYNFAFSKLWFPNISIWNMLLYGCIVIFMVLFGCLTKIAELMMAGVDKVIVRLFFNLLCFFHSLVYTPVGIYSVVAMLKSLSVADQSLSFPSVLQLILNASLFLATTPHGVVFTLVHGVFYIDYLIQKYYYRRSHVENASIFGIYTFPLGPQLSHQAPQSTINDLALNEIEFENLEDEQECSICLEYFKDRVNLISVETCKHVFHKECMAKWLKYNNICPLCRMNLKKELPLGSVEIDK